MSIETRLPAMSVETRQKLKSYGFVNHLYDYTKMPSYCQPRGAGFNAFTYFVMGVSATGAVLSKRYHSQPTCFIFSFLAAPFIAFIQKYEADTFIYSDLSKRNPRTLLQRYPILSSSFKQVSKQVDDQIAKYQQRVRDLEQTINRNAA